MGDKSISTAKTNFDAAKTEQTKHTTAATTYRASDPSQLYEQIVVAYDQVERAVDRLKDACQLSIDGDNYNAATNTSLAAYITKLDTFMASWPTAPTG